MKIMIFIFALIGQFIPNAHTQEMKKFTRSERTFIKNVVQIQNDKPLEVVKRTDLHIVIEFVDTRVILKPNGYVGEMWIKIENEWMSIGTEKDAY